MKISVLLSVGAAAFSFIPSVKAADVPDPSIELNACLSWAQGTSDTQAASTRCYALNNCNMNESDNADSLRECIFAAEQAYLSAIGGAQPQVFGAPGGVTVPAVTDVADSYYEEKGPDHKGWENADQGN